MLKELDVEVTKIIEKIWELEKLLKELEAIQWCFTEDSI